VARPLGAGASTAFLRLFGAGFSLASATLAFFELAARRRPGFVVFVSPSNSGVGRGISKVYGKPSSHADRFHSLRVVFAAEPG
jgi:hypothetical protein